MKKSSNVEVVAIVSDIHFDQVDWPTWNAFKKWHADQKPDKTVILGDFVDFGMLSKYLQGSKDPVNAIPQIAMFVQEANALKKNSKNVIVMEGNHDERWDKAIFGAHGAALKDAKGLTLKDQCMYHGLDKGITWLKEDLENTGVKCGPFVLRHGHRQGTGWGARHLAANRIQRSLGVSEVFGHYHRAQMFCQTAHGKTAVAIANPHMSGEHSYTSDPDWQRGFTVLELYGPDNIYATPHLVLIQDGRFAWGGTLYDGNIP
jgi:predicted phosphodiesterase